MKNIKSFILLFIITAALFACKKDGSKTNPNNGGTATPVAAFTWAGTQRVNADIEFTNTSKNADTYQWDFGDGQTSNKQHPAKIKYAGEGAYTVTLTATSGVKHTLYQQTIVIAPDNNPAPHFSFTFKDQKNSAPAVVSFTNESVNAVAYKWVINGETYNDKNQTYIFTQPGKYLVSLTAINGNLQASYADEVTIVANNNPQASFVLAYHPYPYKVNEEIQLVNQSKNADAWLWTFGANGPAPSTDQHPVIKFSSAGNYTITLIAKKGALQSQPKAITLKINP